MNYLSFLKTNLKKYTLFSRQEYKIMMTLRQEKHFQVPLRLVQMHHFENTKQ